MARHRTGSLLKRNGNYYVSWRLDGKLFTKVLRDEDGKSITDRRKAEQAKVKVMAPFLAGDQVAVLESLAARIDGRKADLERMEAEQNPPLTLDRVWAEYVAAPNRPDSGPLTLSTYAYQFGRFVSWMKEKHQEILTLRGVTQEIAEEYAFSLNHAAVSPATYNKHVAVLTLVFRVLKHKAKLTGNVWEEIQRKRNVPRSRRELTIDELKRVCQSAAGELRTMLAVGIYTGLRESDVATLRWGETDLARGIIRRIPNKTARRNPKPVLIPIHPVLREILEEIPAAQREVYVLPKIAHDYVHRRRELVRMIQNHFTSCGIRVHQPGTGENGKRAVVEVGYHSLRHSFVSLCRESNAPLAVVEAIVGHSNPAMTRHYTHVGELAAGRAVAALPAVIGGETKPETSKRDPEALLREIRGMIEGLTEAKLAEQKAALLALLDAQNAAVQK